MTPSAACRLQSDWNCVIGLYFLQDNAASNGREPPSHFDQAVEQLAQVIEVPTEYFHDVVGVSCLCIALDDFRAGSDKLAERRVGSIFVATETDRGVCDNSQAEFAVIEDRSYSSYVTFRAQPRDPACALGSRQMDAIGDLNLRQIRLTLQEGQDSEVVGVEITHVQQTNQAIRRFSALTYRITQKITTKMPEDGFDCTSFSSNAI